MSADGAQQRAEAPALPASERGVSATYDLAVIGAGYVGMPHAHTFAEAGKKVLLCLLYTSDAADEL